MCPRLLGDGLREEKTGAPRIRKYKHIAKKQRQYMAYFSVGEYPQNASAVLRTFTREAVLF